jgi:hypothetical protein
MMVYNTENHWVCGLCTLSRILNTRKHSVLGTGSVSFFRWGGMLKLKLIYNWQSVGQSVLMSGLGPVTNFSFSLKFPSESCGFIIFWCPLWREGGSVIYCTIASGPFQSSHSYVEVPQNSRLYFHCLIWDFPNLQGQVPIFISPRNRVAHKEG